MNSKASKIKGKIQRANMTIAALEQTEETEARDLEIARLRGLVKRWEKDLRAEGGEPTVDFSALATLLGAKVQAPALTIQRCDAIMIGADTLEIFAAKIAALVGQIDLTDFADQDSYNAGVAALVNAALAHTAEQIAIKIVRPGPDGNAVETIRVADLTD